MDSFKASQIAALSLLAILSTTSAAGGPLVMDPNRLAFSLYPRSGFGPVQAPMQPIIVPPVFPVPVPAPAPTPSTSSSTASVSSSSGGFFRGRATDVTATSSSTSGGAGGPTSSQSSAVITNSGRG